MATEHRTPTTEFDGLYEVPGSRLRELRDAEAERDRYREALEQIAGISNPAPDWEFMGRPADRERAIRRCAREALAMRQEDTHGQR